MKLEPIILSLLDTDLYKFNMDQVIFHKHTDLSGEYFFRCRSEGVIFTKEMFDEINAQIDHLCTLTFTKEELGFAVGRTSLAIAAVTDPALALALAKALGEPEKHKAAIEVLSAKAERMKKRAAEAKAHKRNVRTGKKK